MSKYYLCFSRTVLLLICLELVPFNLLGQDCDQVLQNGIFNTASITASSVLTQTFNEYIYAADFSTHQQAIDAGISIGTIVYGVPLQLGGTFSKQQKDTWRSTNEQFRTSSTAKADKLAIMIRIVSPDVLKAWTRCVEVMAPTRVGLYGWIQDVNSTSAILHINWIPMAGDVGKAPKITGSSIIGGVRSDNSSNTVLPVTFQLLQGANGNLVSLVRRVNEALVVVVNTTRGDISCTLEAPPKPSNLTINASPEEIMVGESSNLIWSVNQADQIVIDNGIGSVQPNGSAKVTPQTTTIYKITATNTSGSISAQAIVNVKPLPPVFSSATVSFFTTNDNKDDDTNVTVIIKSGGNTIAQWSGKEGEWKDNTSHGPFGLAVVERPKKELMLGNSQVVLIETPNGHDEWHFNWTLVLNFSDGSSKRYDFGGDVDHDRNTLTNTLN